MTAPAFIRPIQGGIELRVKVVAGASRSAIVGPLGDRLKVRVAAPAEGGRANRAVVELLAEWLGAGDVAIVSGHGSAEKIVRVADLHAISREKLQALRGSAGGRAKR